jgi:hypothetical protein
MNRFAGGAGTANQGLLVVLVLVMKAQVVVVVLVPLVKWFKCCRR